MPVCSHACVDMCIYTCACAHVHACVHVCTCVRVRAVISCLVAGHVETWPSWVVAPPASLSWGGTEEEAGGEGERAFSPTPSWYIQEKRRFAKQEEKCEPIFRELVLEKHRSEC